MGKESKATRARLLNRLRERVDAIPATELTQDIGGRASSAGSDLITQNNISFGCEALDDHLPGRGLKTGALHEVVAQTYRDRPAAVGFTTALAVRLSKVQSGPVLWVQLARGFRDFGPVHGSGLAAMGLDPDRVILAAARDEADVLWAMEEGLHCTDLAGVIGEVRAHARVVDLTASRRLHMAAGLSGVTAFMLRGSPDEAAGMEALGSSAALTRWAVASAPSAELSGVLRPLDRAIGRPRWRLDLLRCRTVNGTMNATGTGDAGDSKTHQRGTGTMTQIVEWNHETHHFHMAAPLADRPVLPRPATGPIGTTGPLSEPADGNIAAFAV